MSKFTQYLKATAIAMLIPFSAHAQKKASANNTKAQMASLTKAAGKYNLWDNRKPTDYDATKDFLKYPIKMNYTVDSLMYAYDKMPEAYYQEGIVLNYVREYPELDNQNIPSTIVHEGLHFIQAAKVAYLEKQPEYKGLTFRQAYEIEMCREIASHIGDKLADELAKGKSLDIIDIARITNKETQRFLNMEAREVYLDQFYNTACNHFNPDATEESGKDSFMKIKAAIMSQYIVVNGEVKSINLLPLLTDANFDLIKPQDSAMKKYADEKEGINELRRRGYYKGGDISDGQKLKIMAKRYRMHISKWEKDDLFSKSSRSSNLSMDVSAYFPHMSAQQYEQTQALINKMAQNEASGKHNENQTVLNQFISAKDKTAIQTASLMATETRVNR